MTSTEKLQKIKSFDPDGLASTNNLFGLPFNYAESETIVLPVPWEVTVSYAAGTAKAPEAIREASWQVDLYDPFLKDAWKKGVYMLDLKEDIDILSMAMRKKAEVYLNGLGEGNVDEIALTEINEACATMVQWVEDQILALLQSGKRVALLGGDHSTPLGFIKALQQVHQSFGILQIDAHADLRDAYEGFIYSHASIMYNAIKEKGVSKLVQVGIRDYCEAEQKIIESQSDKIKTFFDRDIKAAAYRGITWEEQCKEIITALPNKVYLSFDIDGLDPKLCPNTGTPVAGGFEAEQVLFLLETLVAEGKEIIGFDLNEVAPGGDEWDANVGARLLYRICNIMAVSQKNMKF